MKTKKFLKIALLVVIAALFIWTFVFLYQKSQPKVTVYETIVPEVTDLEKTTVATGKVEPRDEVLIKPQISGIIADEMAIGMINQKTTAVRLIPVIGKDVGEMVEFGGLLGYAPIMPVNRFGCEAFVNRGGRIPAPIHSFKN